MTHAQLVALIAGGINDARPLTPPSEATTDTGRHRLQAANAVLDNATIFLADRLTMSFPRFDRAAFFAACKVR